MSTWSQQLLRRILYKLGRRDLKLQAEELEVKATKHIAKFSDDSGEAYIRKGKALARKLRSTSISLGSSKAYEFSPHVQKTALAAAKVAYLVYGPDAKEFDSFETEVGTYEDAVGREYQEFKSCWHTI